LIDTGGWQAKPSTALEQKVVQQAEKAIAQADVIIFLVDAKDGIIAADEEIADMLRASNKPIVLAANKVDSAKQAGQVADFYRLGIGKPIAISAYHNQGIDELMDAVLAALPPPSPTILVEPEGVKLAIVGRPNVGKSTLLNALLDEERAIVHEAPGTTRDSLDAVVDWDDKKFLLIDTAGIKRRGRVDSGVDYYSLLRALQAINRCDVALLLIDASESITAQDMHIAGYIIEVGKGIILVVNKWDLVPQSQRQEFNQYMKQRFRFISYAPILYISAELRQNIDRILPQAWQVWQERQKRLPQAEVDMVIKQAFSSTASHRLEAVAYCSRVSR
jgi:GTP-binding protein